MSKDNVKKKSHNATKNGLLSNLTRIIILNPTPPPILNIKR